MDKIQKSLQRLQLHKENFTGLQIKKLKGSNNIFRVRKGDLRIIYQIRENTIYILAIERRSEKTYRNF